MIVAPLNALSEGTFKMVGLLCISSPRKYVFSARHVEFTLFAADTVANSVATVVPRLSSVEQPPLSSWISKRSG